MSTPIYVGYTIVMWFLGLGVGISIMRMLNG